MSSSDMNEFLGLFIQESSDRFEELTHDLLKLENTPSDEETLYSILRHVHSLKGSAGMFGFDSLKDIAHRMEDLMELAHASPDMVGADIMNILFEGCDLLQQNFKSIASGESANETTDEEKDFMRRLDELIENADKASSGKGLLDDFLDQVEELSGAISEIWDTESLMKNLKRLREKGMPSDEAPAKKVTAEVADSFIGDCDVSVELARVEAVLSPDNTEQTTPEQAEQFFKDIAVIVGAVEKLEVPSLAEALEETRESIKIFTDLDLEFDSMQLEFYSQIMEELRPHVVSSEKETAQVEEELVASSSGGSLARKTVRIDEAKIDTFLDSVGEMIILGEAFNHVEKQLLRSNEKNHPAMRDFKGANSAFAAHIFELQNSLMDVRRVELRNITGSLARLVRDVALNLNKKIKFEHIDDGAVIDKSLLDDLNTCLVHIVRNCADHGLEMPEDRITAGKSEEGTITLSAVNEEGSLIVKVIDDGKGINVEALRAKAIQLGMPAPQSSENLSSRELTALMFLDGLSTAESVSDISGRGIGMSAVSESIKNVGGTIEVNTTQGVGTEVTLRIPLSIMLSVVDGLTVKCHNSGFIIPIRNVLESFHPKPEDITNVSGKGQCVMLRDELFPMMVLSEHFGLAVKEDNDRSIGILIQTANERICILVDEIIDHQQVVIKEIEGIGNLKEILGGALLGDGTIGLVLNTESISL